jgi:hypothetical protein
MWSEHNCPPHLGEVLTTRVLFLREGALTVRRGRLSGRPYCFHNGLRTSLLGRLRANSALWFRLPHSIRNNDLPALRYRCDGRVHAFGHLGAVLPTRDLCSFSRWRPSPRKTGSANEDYLQPGGTSCRWRCSVNRGGWRHPCAARWPRSLHRDRMGLHRCISLCFGMDKHRAKGLTHCPPS